MRVAARPPPPFTLLISNYPPRHAPASVLLALADAVHRRVGGRPDFVSQEGAGAGSFAAALPNAAQADATLGLNGALVLGHPLWVVRAPAPLAALAPLLSRVFRACACGGVVDLARLRAKVAAAGGARAMVRLNNRDFVEFLLFRLGSDARDDRFCVRTLVLCDNGIRAIDPWSPFLHFLPGLRAIHAENNAIAQRPELPEWPHVAVHWEPQRPRAAQRR